MFSRLDIILACDGQTDRQAPYDGNYRAMQSVARVNVPWSWSSAVRAGMMNCSADDV